MVEGLLAGEEMAPEIAGILPAFILGQPHYLTESQEEVFKKTGTLHLFAISGLHVGMVATFLYLLLRCLPLSRAQVAVAGLIVLFLYVGITGASVSAQRAYLMVLFFWGSHLFWRQGNPLAALSGSAVIVLIWKPEELWNPGFQLSYGVVSSILLYGVPMTHYIREKLPLYTGLPPTSYKFRHKLVVGIRDYGTGLAAISFSAIIMSNILTTQHFQTFAPGGFFLNLVLVPLAGILMALGLVSALAGLAGIGFVSHGFNFASYKLIWVMNEMPMISKETEMVSFGLKYLPHSFGLWQALMVVYLMAALPYHKRPRISFLLPPVTAAIGLIFFTTSTIQS